MNFKEKIRKLHTEYLSKQRAGEIIKKMDKHELKRFHDLQNDYPTMSDEDILEMYF